MQSVPANADVGFVLCQSEMLLSFATATELDIGH